MESYDQFFLFQIEISNIIFIKHQSTHFRFYPNWMFLVKNLFSKNFTLLCKNPIKIKETQKAVYKKTHQNKSINKIKSKISKRDIIKY